MINDLISSECNIFTKLHENKSRLFQAYGSAKTASPNIAKN